MYALCVPGAVNTQGFVWKFFYTLYVHFHFWGIQPNDISILD